MRTLIQGMGLKYTGNCPVPGEKELTFTNVPVYRNGSTYAFKGDLVKPTYTMEYEGKIIDGKMTLNFKYELTESNWQVYGRLRRNVYTGSSATMTPLWYDWNTNLTIRFRIINLPEVGLNKLNMDTYTPNGLYDLLVPNISSSFQCY